MILGMSYCQPSTLSIIIDRNKFKVETVVSSDGPEFKNCIESLNSDDPYFRIPTLFIEKLSTALSLTNKLPNDRKYKVVIFDTPDNLTFAGINLLDAEFISDNIWKPVKFTSHEFNLSVLKVELVSVDEIKSLKERRFKPVRKYNEVNVASAIVSLRDIVATNKVESSADSELNTDESVLTKLRGKTKQAVKIDDEPVFEEDSIDDYSHDNSDIDDMPAYYNDYEDHLSDEEPLVPASSHVSYDVSTGCIDKIITGISSATANKYCRYIVGIDEKSKFIPEKIVEFAESEKGIHIFEAFVDFYKNDLSVDEAAVKHSCSEDDLNTIIDNLDDLDNIKFVRVVKNSLSEETNIKSSTVKDIKKDSQVIKKENAITDVKDNNKNEKVKVQSEIPNNAPMARPLPTSKAKSIVDAIEFAYTNITHDSMDKLQEVVAKYVAYVKGTTKSSYNSAAKSSIKAGASEEYMQQLDKLIHSKYGESLLVAYTDMVLYNASEVDACKLLKVNEADLAMITYYCPVESAEKDRYNKKIPLILYRKHGGNPK